MAHEDLINCFSTFNSEPFFFFKKEDTMRKLRCFEVFKQEADPHYIWVLFKFLKSENLLLRDGAAETIAVLLGRIESQTAFYGSLKQVELSSGDLENFQAAFSPEIYLKLLFTASFNKNGYLREHAVRELAAQQRPEAIKYIIFRLADWVANVGKAAETALRNYFQPEFRDEFLSLLPLLEWLLSVKRSDLGKIRAEIYRFLFSLGFDADFYRKLRSFGDKIKLLYIRNHLRSNEITAEIFELLAEDKLPLVKIELLKHIERLDDDTQKFYIRKFLKDSSVKTRIYAIYSTKPFRAEFLDEIRTAIFDKSEAVRELARFILRDSGIDFAEAYRQKLREDENSVVAILGLAEVGTTEDLPDFEKFIRRPNAPVIIACLSALNRLDKTTAKKYALEFLTHSSGKVRNKSLEILASAADQTALETAREVYRTGGVEQKKTILRLFNRIGGWKVVGDFIIALADADEGIREIGWASLIKWRGRQIYARPLPEDLERAVRLYRELDRNKPELTQNHQHFWASLPFYLR